MKNNFGEVICLIKNGKTGDLMVNGKNYNQAMPGISSLTDLEIAEIATYIYNSWENERGIIEVQDVSKILSLCDGDSLTVGRPQPLLQNSHSAKRDDHHSTKNQ